jgi:hypothetical protein
MGEYVRPDECSDEMGNLRSDVRLLQSDVKRISGIVEGKDGMQMQLNSLISKLDTQEETRDREHKGNTTRLNILIGLGVLVAAWLTILLSIWHH